MSLTDTPSSERIHIAFLGCTNSGKSSVVNAVTGQNLSIVSDIKGTTTDAVKKTMEILPLGPVVIIDTAGIDDTGLLGELRIQKTKEILRQTDIAVLVIDSAIGVQNFDKDLMEEFAVKKIPYIVVFNKSDLVQCDVNDDKIKAISVSAKTGFHINELKNMLAELIQLQNKDKFIISDKLYPHDVVILVTPIDNSAPKGRLILPQQLVLRELLDAHCISVCTQVEELDITLKHFSSPRLVITDSQVFNTVAKIVPENIKLTSFSILMARYKGELDAFINGINSISSLKDGDKILISEGCTHHRQCNDIGSVKIPALIKKSTNKNFNFEFSSGKDFPEDLEKYKLIIHCGGCMLNEAEMKSRIKMAMEQNIPIANYGILMAYFNGILERVLEIFKNT